MLRKRRNAEAHLTEESVKRQKQLETENKDLRKMVRKQAKTIVALKSGNSTVYRCPSKGWSEHSRQHRYNIKKEVAGNVYSALSFCEEACLKPRKVEIENVSEGTIEVLNVSTGEFEGNLLVTESCLVLIVRNTWPYISKINWPYQIVATTN